MPVKWLYLLADGRLVAPTGGNAADGLTFASGEAPSAANPITGRIAFWTDDESCKVNVNTATEGVPWDVPRALTDTEVRLGLRQPAQNEFSRYPGHPAQTSLSPVLQGFGADWIVDINAPDAQRALVVERYMNLNPRIPWGGSKGGSEAPTAAITPGSVTPGGSGANYKEAGNRHRYELRYRVDTAKTLRGFTRRFDRGDAFRSASEICEIFLVPRRITNPEGKPYSPDAAEPPASYADMTAWWNGDPASADAFDATGDNSRESPYNQIYPRLTTRSNTFTVHYRVQMLKKSRGSNPARWVEGRDRVLSEYRGSATLERYLDPNDREIAQTSQTYGSGGSLDSYYRLRVIDRKQFAP